MKTEQLKEILSGKPDGATHYSIHLYWKRLENLGWYFHKNGEWWQSNVLAIFSLDMRSLADIAENVALREEVERLKAEADKYPMQPIFTDQHGVNRFEENPIINHLACEVCDLNTLSIWCIENNIDTKYQEQLAQLIGYSVDGYGTLSYVSDNSYDRADSLRNQKEGG